MGAKENQLLKHLQLRFHTVPLNDCLPLIRTFFSCYTEIFQQILPRCSLDFLNRTCFANQVRLSNIFHNRPQMIAFSIFTGIPLPSERSVLLKLLFYRKMKRFPFNSILNNIFQYYPNLDLPMFRHINSLVKNWIPCISLQQLKDPKHSDDSFKTHIIQKQMIPILSRNK